MMKKSIVGILIGIQLFFCSCGANTGELLFEEETKEETSTSQEVANQSVFEDSDVGKPYVEELNVQEQVATIFVHVCGAVASPGVVEIPEGSRVCDALMAAGGFLPDGDENYVNLAALLTDGEQLYFPTKEEGLERKEKDAAVNEGKVDLNSATLTELVTLPGIGESRAADIIRYREDNGEFTAIEDIMKVNGIKESTFEKIKESIVVW